MAFGDSLPQINLGVQGGTQGYFSGMENVAEFLENIDNNLTYYEIPTQLACAYLKGRLTGRALDWFEFLGSRVVEDKATDYAHLKQDLREEFPLVRNRFELETRFYASSQKHSQKPSDFVYDLLKIHKQLKLDMKEEKLLDHVISRLEPQFLDYVEELRDANQSASNRFPNRYRQENWRETRGNNRYSDNSRPQREFNKFEGQGVGGNRRFDSRRRSGQTDHRFHNQDGRQGDSRNGEFRGQNGQNSNRCEYGGDRSRCTENPPDTEHQTIRISSLRMTPVDLPYVPILLNETFITVLWDTREEKSFISEEVYRRYFSYRQRQKTKDRAVTPQGAPCCHLGRGRRVTVNIDQVRVYHPRDSPTQLVLIVMMRHYMKERGLVMGRVGHTRENPETTDKPKANRQRGQLHKIVAFIAAVQARDYYYTYIQHREIPSEAGG
ncbi:UNVERIFIED_CONTAM: hypothetical protein NCL1_45656 [Trichonephila clavipes]